jgi:hypothetical protein
MIIFDRVSGRDVYPRTNELQAWANETFTEWNQDQEKAVWAIKKMVETFGEYEHGTADVEDVFEGPLSDCCVTGEALDAYAAVVKDLALTLFYST